MNGTEVEVLTPRYGVRPAKSADFAAVGTPGGPGRCLWCGSKLRASKAGALKNPEAAQHAGHRGDYADDAFCGLRCGYAFGLRLAVLGRRLQVDPIVEVKAVTSEAVAAFENKPLGPAG